MTDRSTHWSITINNPTETDVLCAKQGWVLTGQYERGDEGTLHYQGMLLTPQVRFSAVKKEFPRAHIEIARDIQALRQYVHKAETRVDIHDPQLNCFTAQKLISDRWCASEWGKRVINEVKKDKPDFGQLALDYIDELVTIEISKGSRCLEFIAINPMWRSSWKKFYSAIIARHAKGVCHPQVPSPPSPTQGSEEPSVQSAT